jgi:nucleoside-diphosphate-sugar epimerase
MKTLITGNLGYIGSVLGDYLVTNGFDVIGLDSGFFQECHIEKIVDIETNLKDIRDINESDLAGVENIIHLAALSNDPLGEFDRALTFEINYTAAVNLAKLAKSLSVKRFIFASTQSIYGYSNSEEELQEDNSLKNPQTAYAESKWLAEQEILALADSAFQVLALRPSTVFGWSPRLRTDIVFNNLLTMGFFTKKINVHSDGLPWRPIIHVLDVCRAIKLALESDLTGQSLNLGVIGGNYRVKELAMAASKSLNNIPVIFNTENINDSRSYKVDFNKARQLLQFQASMSLEEGAKEIIDKLSLINESKEIFINKTNRLAKLKDLLLKNKVKDDLRFN